MVGAQLALSISEKIIVLQWLTFFGFIIPLRTLKSSQGQKSLSFGQNEYDFIISEST